MGKASPSPADSRSALGPGAQPPDSGLRLVEAKKLTVREAAKAAGMSESAMRMAIRADEIPVLKFGTKMLVLEVDLEAYLRRHYVYEGGKPLASSGPAANVPAWVVNSPILRPERLAS